MLQVSRDNDKVVISVESGLAFDCAGIKKATLDFSWQCGRPYLADVLARHINNLIGDALMKARSEAYEQGWKDAKSKRTKRDHFEYWL